MAHHVVALFDTASDAQAAKDDLIRSGFDAASIRLVDQRSTTASARSVASGADRSLWEEIKDFFTGDSEGDRYEYEEGIRRGGVLLSVNAPEERVNQAVNVLMKHNPVDVDRRAGEWRSAGWTGSQQSAAAPTTQRASTPAAAKAATSTSAQSAAAANRGGEQAIPIVEEDLQVGKRQVERGVRIYQHVTTRPVEKQVQLRDERVTIERRPADRPAAAANLNDAFQEKSYQVTETHEEPVVQKTARVVEEVVVNREANVRTETIRDQVRRTDVDVQQQAAGGNTADDSRTIYERDFANSGVAYDQWKPAYEFGSKLASDQRYQGRDWNTVEPEARQNFERSMPGRKWDQFRDAVHRAYDRTRAKV